MCGINGFNWGDLRQIRDMNTCTRNRGPDDEGVFVNPDISLGHSRLSIIDLSINGHQPMCNEDRSIWIIFNGEIYNFKSLREDLIRLGHIFTSDTDTEVIIHAYEEYGLECVNKFNGMWAFVLYDTRKNILVLCRDQFGIKPLYYYNDTDRFIFSSMISAILLHKIPTEPNNQAIMEYLAFNLEDHNNNTFFANISKVPTDSFLVYHLDKKQCSFVKWYYPKTQSNIDIKTIKNSFFESVKLRTISDVPVGSCLSGGIDSTAIVSTLNTILPTKFNTYSLIAPGYEFDESRYIEEIGKKANIQQFFTQLSKNDFLHEIYDFIHAQEEPVTGLSPYAQYRVMKLAHEQKAKVLLDGQGGDEIFAGYTYYFAYYFYELLAGFKLITLGKEVISYRKNFKNFYPFKLLAFILLPKKLKFSMWKIFADSWINKKYLFEQSHNQGDPRWEKMTLNECLSLTLYSTAIPHLLRWEDKNSMRWSIETRPPFLDINLVQAAMSLPSAKKISNGRTKVIFKESIDDILPSLIKERKDKIGFAAPGDDFFRDQEIIHFANEIIYSDSFKNRPYWHWEEIEKQYNRHIQGNISIGDTIWKWIHLEIWLREFFPNLTGQVD